jgi:hypothetical protein
MRSRSIARRFAVAGILALTVSALVVPAASAGSHERILTKGGAVWFDHSGEYIAALDLRKDGYSVRAYLDWDDRNGHHTEAVTDNLGARPGPVDPDRSVYRQISVPEHTTVTLTMCYSQGDYNRQCSRGQLAEA